MDRTQPRAFGPNLAGLGSKTSQAWIFRWLKDPKHYWKATYMPNLRLTDQEALDISAYLVSSRNAEFDKTEAPAAKKQALDWLATEYLSARMSLAATAEKMKTMTERDRKLFLGERMINRYGCFGCHEIKGFENVQPIGTELTAYENFLKTNRWESLFVDIMANGAVDLDPATTGVQNGLPREFWEIAG